MGDSHSSDGPRGGGRPNRSRSGGGNRNRNRNRNREGGGGGNRNRQGGSNKSNEWKPSGGRAPRKPEPKPTFFQKLLSFFGLGKKEPQKSSKPANRREDGKSGRKDRPKRERKPLEVTSGRLFIGNIDYNGTEEQLAEHFAQVGEVKSAEIVVNPHNGKPKGFAFVEMGDIDQAKKAVEELNDKPFLTRNLLVSGAKSDGAKKGRDRGPRSDRGQDRERGGRREGGDRGGRSGGRERGGRREKREHSDSKEPAMKPIEIEQVSGPGLRLENLNAEFSEEDLRDLFEGIGKVDDHHIDSGYTLVQMASTQEAQKAVEVLHAKDFMGKRLKVIGAELETAEEGASVPVADAPAQEAPVAESKPEEATPSEVPTEEPAVEESAAQEDAAPPKEEN